MVPAVSSLDPNGPSLTVICETLLAAEPLVAKSANGWRTGTPAYFRDLGQGVVASVEMGRSSSHFKEREGTLGDARQTAIFARPFTFAHRAFSVTAGSSGFSASVAGARVPAKPRPSWRHAHRRVAT